MPKPWAKIEVGYWDHIKFQSLNANAICLWHEGKNYCDKHHTDGLLPLVIVKQFRFYGKKAVDALTTRCETPKPDGTPYAPLWEAHPVGFKMHDYLDHNDCREVVEARMEAADARREAEKKRKADWRAKKAEVSHGTNHGTEAGHVPDVPDLSRSTTEAVPQPEPERTIKAAATPRSLAREPNQNGNFRVIEKIAIELLGEESFESESDFSAAVKSFCAQRAIIYDSDVVARSCASAKVKRMGRKFA